MTALPKLHLADGAEIAPRPQLAVRHLALTQFRSYQRLELAADAGPIVLAGPNGAGKTNLLEALSLLAPGRGLRGARLADLARRDAPPGPADAAWAVFARIATPEGERAIGTGRDPDDAADRAAQRRVVHVDGVAVKGQAALAEHVRMAWLTPDMDRLFTDGASERRRFLDRLVYGFVPAHARNLSAYDQAMRERNRLLSEGSRDERWLGAIEQSMAESGIAIAAARRDAVSRLALAAEAGIGTFPVPELALRGDVDDDLGRGPALAAEEALRRRLADSRRVDTEARRTTSGPHRTDLAVVHRAKSMPAALCSTGEQKALLVGIVLAAARLLRLQHGAAPILLLDEIAAHLDAARRIELFDEVVALGAQAWMTGTDPVLFAALAGRAQFFAVADRVVSPSAPPQPSKAER